MMATLASGMQYSKAGGGGGAINDFHADWAISIDVRDSTLRSLKLTCPSAQDIDCAPLLASAIDSPHMESDPFVEVDEDFSEQDELLPRSKHKTQYRPRHSKIAATSADTSSDESSSTLRRPDRSGKSASLLISPISSSSLGAGIDSEHEDLVQRFYLASKERDLLWKELQKKSVAPYGISGRAAVVYRSEEKTLIEEVHALRNGIQIWAEEYFSGPMRNRSKRPHMHWAKELFGHLTANSKTYLENPEERPLLIQAYVWSKLQQKIFSNWQRGCGYVWAGKLGDKQLRSINDTLRNGTMRRTPTNVTASHILTDCT